MRYVYLALLIAAPLATTHIQAQDELEQAETVTRDTVHRASQAQQRINTTDDETRSLLEQYRSVVRQSQLFEADAKLMQARVDAQQTQLDQFDQSIREIDNLKRELTPLLQRMIVQLSEFIQLDIPFQTEERLAVVETLQAAMVNPNLNDTERFRLIVEAWQTEIDYGFELKSWRAILDEDNRRMVTYLRIGRVGLYYRGLDGQDAGYWHRPSQRWNRISSENNAEQISQIDLGIRMARNQAAPELLTLPLPAPQDKTIATNESANKTTEVQP